MNKTMQKMDKWQEVLAKQNLSEEVRQLLNEVYMHIGDQEYEMNYLKVKILMYEGVPRRTWSRRFNHERTLFARG